MADQTRRDDSAGGTRGGQDRRNGFGDDQGTRIGRPDEPSRRQDAGRGDSGSARSGPSTRPVKEGLEGAIFEEDDAGNDRGSTASGGSRAHGSDRSTTGAGGEAAEGVHATRGRDQSERSAIGRVDNSDSQANPGSEPLHGRTYEHKGGYGGEQGEPRK